MKEYFSFQSIKFPDNAGANGSFDDIAGTEWRRGNKEWGAVVGASITYKGAVVWYYQWLLIVKQEDTRKHLCIYVGVITSRIKQINMGKTFGLTTYDNAGC